MSEALKEMQNYHDYLEDAYPSYLAPSKEREYHPEDKRETVKVPPYQAQASSETMSWTWFEKAWLVLSMIITTIMSVLIIFNQTVVKEKEMSMLYLQDQIQTYHLHSEELRSDMALMYNYQDIKEAAEGAGLSIDKARIGNFQP